MTPRARAITSGHHAACQGPDEIRARLRSVSIGHIGAAPVSIGHRPVWGGPDVRTRSVLALVAATALLAGCDAASPAESGTPSATPSSETSSASAADPAAAQALGQATAALGNTSFKITMTSGPGFKLTGQMDAPGGKASA